VVIAALAPFAGPAVALAAFGVIAAITVAAGVAANALLPGRQPATVLELAPLRGPIPGQVLRKAWGRFRSFATTATPLMLIGSFALGLAYAGGVIGPVESALGPVVRGWLGLPPVVGIALVFAFLRKELALQLLVVLAVAEIGAGAASIGSFLSPAQLFVYAITTAVSIPCLATLATLVGEFGRRAALVMTLATLGIALLAGGLVARLLGIA
jgi:ferrous iron transport protein B